MPPSELRINLSSVQYDSQVQSKDSLTHPAAPESNNIYYAQEDKKKLYSLAHSKAYAYYNVQSTKDNTVKAWLMDPYI